MKQYTNFDIFTCIIFDNVITPTAFAANTNDWSPSGLNLCNVIRMSATTGIDLTGLVAQEPGRVICLLNIGSSGIKLKTQSASSTAANRFALRSDKTVEGQECCILIYDGVDSRWRMLSNYI